MNEIKCPNCNNSNYIEHYSTRTALGWYPHYKDGKIVNDDPNITTTYCECCNCDHKFHYTIQYGAIIEIIDDGEIVKVPTIVNANLTVGDDDTILTNEKVAGNTNIWIESSAFKEPVIPFNIDNIEKLKVEIDELRSEVHELQKTVWELEHPGEWYDY